MTYEVKLFNKLGNHFHTHKVDAETQWHAISEAQKYANMHGIEHASAKAIVKRIKFKKA